MNKPRLSILHVVVFLVIPLWWFVPQGFDWSKSIVGAPISDVWNGWWSMLWTLDHLQSGGTFCSEQINYPRGGCIAPIDWTGTLWMFLFSMVGSPVLAFNLTLYSQVVLIGIGMALFVRAIGSECNLNVGLSQMLWGGVLMQLSTVVVTGLHNGSTEVLSLGWVLLGCVGWTEFLNGKRWSWIWVVVVGATSWYGVLGFLIFAVGSTAHKQVEFKRLFVYVSMTVSAWGGLAWWTLSKSDVVLIKRTAEMNSVRRTIGSADPLTYLVPWSYRSPNFSDVSRFGEMFVHSAYIGWVIVLTCMWFRPIKRSYLMVIVTAGVLSLGPVLVLNAEPLVFNDQIGIPLPYWILEPLPLFSSLTLLYRLSWVVIALLTTFAVLKWKGQLGWGLFVFSVIEMCLISPNKDLPLCSDVQEISRLEILREQPSGAVINYPLVGGRPHLMAQWFPDKPTFGTLNFPANSTVYSFLDQIKAQSHLIDEEFITQVQLIAKQKGIRYWIIDSDPTIMPDAYWSVIQRIRRLFPKVHSSSASLSTTDCSTVWGEIEVFRVW